MLKIYILSVGNKSNLDDTCMEMINRANKLIRGKIEIKLIELSPPKLAQNLATIQAQQQVTKYIFDYLIKRNVLSQNYSKVASKVNKVNKQIIFLDVLGKELDTSTFYQRFIANSVTQEIYFIIGEATGFAQDLITSFTKISLSKMTLPHKVARLVLCEQLYRAICIDTNHPYAK